MPCAICTRAFLFTCAAGTGKTTLAIHLANLLERRILLVFGDDQYTSADLIGNQKGYNRKKVVDNFIHTVVKLEDEFRQSWVDARLTTACREGFTLVYDEFNRSRPEVNNVLLSVLKERLLVLPAASQQQEYIRAHPHFRVIFTASDRARRTGASAKMLAAECRRQWLIEKWKRNR